MAEARWRPPEPVRAQARRLARTASGVDAARLADIGSGMEMGRPTLLAVLASAVTGPLGEWAQRMYGGMIDRAQESEIRALTAAAYDTTAEDTRYYGILDPQVDDLISAVVRASADGLDRWTRDGWQPVPDDMHPVGLPYRELTDGVLADALVACAEGHGLIIRATVPKAWLPARRLPLVAAGGNRDGVYAAVDEADTSAVLTLVKVTGGQGHARTGGQWTPEPDLLPYLAATGAPLAIVHDRDIPAVLRAYDDHEQVFPPILADVGKPDDEDAPGEGPTVAGLAVQADDTGRVLMLQRALDESDPAGGDWEFPGGHLEGGEDPLSGAQREWQEETGISVPDGEVTDQWDSPDGVYRCYVWAVPFEDYIALHDRDDHTNPDDPDGDQVESIAWWEPDDLPENPALRSELVEQLPDVLDALDNGGGAYDARDDGSEDDYQSSEPGPVPDFSDKMMVALPVPDDAAQTLALPGGLDPSDMHVTLAYLGTPDEAGADLDTIAPLVEQWASAHQPFTGEVSGPAQFEASGDEDATPQVALVDAQGLQPARQHLVDYLTANGVNVNTDHEFTPHITRAYGSQHVNAGIGATPLNLDTVSVQHGDRRRDIPLGALTGDPLTATAASFPGQKYRHGWIPIDEARKPSEPLYHGSLHKIENGTVLTPGGATPDASIHSGDYVYATTRPESARYFASMHDTSPETDAPVWVHRVEPVGAVEPEEMPGEDERFRHGNYRGKSFRVVDSHQVPSHYAVTASTSDGGGGGGGWNESLHPRTATGEFAPKGTQTARKTPEPGLEQSRSAKAGTSKAVKAVSKTPYHKPAGGKGSKAKKSAARKASAKKKAALRKSVAATERQWKEAERNRHGQWQAAWKSEALAETQRQVDAQARIASLDAGKRHAATQTESKRHLAWTRRRQAQHLAESKRHDAATKKVTADIADLNIERDKQLAGLTAQVTKQVAALHASGVQRIATALVAGHPYPGQRFRHGWIPVAGFNPGAYHERRHPQHGHVELGHRTSTGVRSIGSVHKHENGGFTARHTYGGREHETHHANEGEARSAVIRGHEKHTESNGPADAAEAFRMSGPDLKKHAANGSTVAQTEIDRRAAKRAGKTTPKPEPTREPEAGKPEPQKAPEGVTTERKIDRNGNVYHDVHRGDQPIGKVLKTSNGWQAERPDGSWAPFSSVPAATDWLNRHHEMSKKSEPLRPRPEPPKPEPKPEPGQARDMTAAERYAQNKGDLNVGDEVSVPMGGGNRVGKVTGFDQYGRAQMQVSGHGTVTRSASDVSKDIHPSTRAAEERRRVGDWRNTPTETLQYGLRSSRMNPEQKTAMRAELQRRGVTPADEAAPKPPPPVAREPGPETPGERRARLDAEAKKAANDENVSITPAGYSVESRVYSHRMDGTPALSHTQTHTATGRRVGHVQSLGNGKFNAQYSSMSPTTGRSTRKDLGDFSTRKEAHEAIAAHHNAISERQQSKAAAQAKRQAKATPVGVFQPYTPQGDGTDRGAAAAAKIKQAFKVGNHTVNIETPMSKEQTKAFLDDVHQVLVKSGHMDGPGVQFMVPSGDKHFRSSGRGVTGAYVRDGQRTIFVNPKIANGAYSERFGSSDSFMPAARGTTGRQYTLTHEMGHIVDNDHDHTEETSHLGSRQVLYRSRRPEAAALHREHQGNLSRYGKTNPAEGYAEAYAQWIQGGPGSSPAADAYAAKYGWPIPAWYQEKHPNTS